MNLNFLNIAGLTTVLEELKGLFTSTADIDNLRSDTAEYVTDIDYSTIAFDTSAPLDLALSIKANWVTGCHQYILSWNAARGTDNYFILTDEPLADINLQIEGKYLFYVISDGQLSLDIWEHLVGKTGTFKFYVVSVTRDGDQLIYGNISNSVSVTKLITPEITLDGNTLSWNSVDGAKYYFVLANPQTAVSAIKIGDVDYSFWATTSCSHDLSVAYQGPGESGTYDICVFAISSFSQDVENWQSDFSNTVTYNIP